MPFGIQNVTAPNMSQIIDIANTTDYTSLMVNVNNVIYNGYLYFVLLWVLWIILFWATNEQNNNILQNAFYSGFVVSLVSLFLRAIEVYHNGVLLGLVTDRQMWIFPVLTALLGLVLWMTKNNER